MIQAEFIFSIAVLSFADDADQLLEWVNVAADEPVGLTRCPSSRSRRGRSPWGIDSWQSLRSASIAIRVAVSRRLVLPGSLPRMALTRERNRARITSAPSGDSLFHDSIPA